MNIPAEQGPTIKGYRYVNLWNNVIQINKNPDIAARGFPCIPFSLQVSNLALPCTKDALNQPSCAGKTFPAYFFKFHLHTVHRITYIEPYEIGFLFIQGMEN
jgi:hypothetical protein